MKVKRIEDLDGMSIKDSKRMPHPADLKRWEGLYEIDTNLGIFRVKDIAENLNTFWSRNEDRRYVGDLVPSTPIRNRY